MAQVDSLKTGKKFKKTEIGKIPVDWEVTELSDVISSYKNGIWGDDPTLNEKSYPIIRSTEITHDGKIDLSTVAFRKISEAQIKKYKLHDNDILLVASSGSPNLIGRSALFEQPYDKRIYLFSNFMIRIRPEKINHYFLFYFLNSQHYHNFLKFLQQTSTGLRNLPKREFIKMKLPFPSLHEQKKIAEILTTVDQAIEKSDQVIEKIKELKKGLMQQLLTRGIGHTEFKKTKIGEIPVDWEVVRLYEIGEIVTGSTPSTKNRAYYDGKYMFVTPFDMSDSKYVKKTATTLSEEGIRISRCLPPGAVMITCIASIGKTGMAAEECCTNQQINSIICGKNIDSHFVYYMMQTKINELKALAGQTAVPIVKKSLFSDIFVFIPSLHEQKKIAEILTSVDEQIEKENANKEKLEILKKGLMQVLLTGKVRVKA